MVKTYKSSLRSHSQSLHISANLYSILLQIDFFLVLFVAADKFVSTLVNSLAGGV